MSIQNVTEKLMLFGLTRQEASVYLSLYAQGEMTGYEVAKVTGISRSNVYNALATLTEKGATYIKEGSPSKYIPVEIQDFCRNKIRHLEWETEYIREHMPKTLMKDEGYITVQGYQNILNKAISMIEHTKERVYLLAEDGVVQRLQKPLQELVERGHKVVIMSETQNSSLPVVWYRSEGEARQFRLIMDSSFVLTGELVGDDSDTCLYSGQVNFVRVFKDAMRNKIQLIEMEEKKG